MIKKLIEVELPLEAIHETVRRERRMYHCRRCMLHLWWARRMSNAARAVIWASLVDDPSAHPDKFPTVRAQNKERKRLFDILIKLIDSRNCHNKEVYEAARAEIYHSIGSELPELLDPFASDGAITLEAQRLGLKVHAHDLNPVAVMINKAMIEIPPMYAGQSPVNPDSRKLWYDDEAMVCPENAAESCDSDDDLRVLSPLRSLAADIQYYGRWLKQRAFDSIGHLYPKMTLSDGTRAQVTAWIWTHTVTCPNAACACQVPLMKSFVLSEKKGEEAFIQPIIDKNNKFVSYKVVRGTKASSQKSKQSSRDSHFKCPVCGEILSNKYVKEQSVKHLIHTQMIAVVAENSEGKIYLTPDDEQIKAAEVDVSDLIKIQGYLPDEQGLFKPSAYGMIEFAELYLPRQLKALTTFSNLIDDVYHQKLMADWASEDYAKAVITYLTFALSKLAASNVSISSWDSLRGEPVNAFGRQVIPMVWTFAECNPFADSSFGFDHIIDGICQSILELPANNYSEAITHEATSDCGLRNLMISTDFPCLDSISHADLSDLFYVWMRRSLREYYPDCFEMVLVPKPAELVELPYRFDGDKYLARAFFKGAIHETCRRLYDYARDDIPVTIFCKSKRNDNGDHKEGFMALSSLEMIKTTLNDAGFDITATWLIDAETSSRSLYSHVLVCRKRP